MPKIFSIKLLFLQFLYEESLPHTLWVTLPFHFFICQNRWNWMVIIPAFYSGGNDFKSHSRDWLS